MNDFSNINAETIEGKLSQISIDEIAPSDTISNMKTAKQIWKENYRKQRVAERNAIFSGSRYVKRLLKNLHAQIERETAQQREAMRQADLFFRSGKSLASL